MRHGALGGANSRYSALPGSSGAGHGGLPWSFMEYIYIIIKRSLGDKAAFFSFSGCFLESIEEMRRRALARVHASVNSVG